MDRKCPNFCQFEGKYFNILLFFERKGEKVRPSGGGPRGEESQKIGAIKVALNTSIEP